MVILCDILYLLLVAFTFPVTLGRMVRTGKYRHNLSQRFGLVPRRRGGRTCVWIHAVSVGEVNATVNLVRQLSNRFGNCDLVISTTTETGQQRAKRLFPDLMVFYYPLDFSWVVRRVLARIRPSIIILMELEIWYNLVALAQQEGIAVALANGRLSRRSLWKYNIIKRFAASMFDKLAFIAVQDETYADRFASLGADPDRIHVLGNMKYDTADLADRVDGQTELAAELGLSPQSRLLVAGSTGDKEEAMVLRAYGRLRQRFAELRLVLVPRKPQRFDAVAARVQRHGFSLMRLSAVRAGGRPSDDAAAVILGDTMGELRKFYALAEVVIVGRTFVPIGGSDVMEIAALAKPMIVGPHWWNFEQPVRALLEEQAIVEVDSVAGPAGLSAAIAKVLSDPEGGRQMGRRARTVIEENQGASRQHADLLALLLEQVQHGSRRTRIQSMPIVSRVQA